MSEYNVLECKATGHGYDLKLKFRVDDETRFLYYAEMPDRNFVRGWSVYEINAENYEANQQEPYIRYVGSFSGDNQFRANAFVAQALREGCYVQSKWDVYYGDIYLVKEIKKNIPKIEYTEIHGNYFEASLDDGSTHYLYRKMFFIRFTEKSYARYTRFYEIRKETFMEHSDDKNVLTDDVPPYIRYLGATPAPADNASEWWDKEKDALYEALTKNMSIYPYIHNKNLVLRSKPCALHESVEIAASVCDHKSNDKYHYVIWKVLLDGQDAVYLLLIQAKEGDTSVKVYEIGENQFQNEYRSYYTSTDKGLERILEIDDSPKRRFNIFSEPLVYFYMIQSEPKYGGIPLVDSLDAPVEYIRLVCTLPNMPDIFSEEFCKWLHDSLRGDGKDPEHKR